LSVTSAAPAVPGVAGFAPYAKTIFVSTVERIRPLPRQHAKTLRKLFACLFNVARLVSLGIIACSHFVKLMFKIQTEQRQVYCDASSQ